MSSDLQSFNLNFGDKEWSGDEQNNLMLSSTFKSETVIQSYWYITCAKWKKLHVTNAKEWTLNETNEIIKR